MRLPLIRETRNESCCARGGEVPSQNAPLGHGCDAKLQCAREDNVPGPATIWRKRIQAKTQAKSSNLAGLTSVEPLPEQAGVAAKPAHYSSRFKAGEQTNHAVRPLNGWKRGGTHALHAVCAGWSE